MGYFSMQECNAAFYARFNENGGKVMINGTVKKLTGRCFGLISYMENGEEKEISFHVEDVSKNERVYLFGQNSVEFTIGIGLDGRPAAKNIRVTCNEWNF